MLRKWNIQIWIILELSYEPINGLGFGCEPWDGQLKHMGQQREKYLNGHYYEPLFSLQVMNNLVEWTQLMSKIIKIM